MAKKKGSPNPFGQYSFEQVLATEKDNYVIQVGGDLFSYNGKMGFSLERAQMFYHDILEGLYDMKKNGSPLEQEDALKCLLLLKIFPLRFH